MTISERKQDLISTLREMADYIERGLPLSEEAEEFFRGTMFTYNDCLKEDREAKAKADAEKQEKLAKKMAEAKKLNVEPIFQQVAEDILEAWIEFDKAHNIDKYGHKRYHKESDMVQDNVRKVERLFKNLIERVTKRVGKIESFDNLRVERGNSAEVIAINGYIKGSDGTANVRSIVAGGFVQRLHIRVLVK